MASDQSNETAATARYAIVPLCGFAADWPSLRYDYDHEVSIVRSNKEINARLVKRAQEYDDGTGFSTVLNMTGKTQAMLKDVEWLLVTRSFAEAAHVPKQEIELGKEAGGIIISDDFGDFSEDLRRTYRESFLTVLRLLGASVHAPFRFLADADIGSEGIVDLEVHACDGDIDYLSVTSETVFDEPTGGYSLCSDDITELNSVWAGLSEMRKLGTWARAVCSEEFFQRLDARGERVRQNVMQEKDNPQAADAAYQNCIRREFRKMQKDNLAEDARMTFLLSLYEEAWKLNIGVPACFLSMCTLLEAIYVTDATEGIAHRLAARIARFIRVETSLEKRLECYNAVKEMYGVRSKLVHGDRLVWDLRNKKNADAVLVACQAARESLCKILTDKDALRVYADRSNSSSQDLKDFLLKLDLA